MKIKRLLYFVPVMAILLGAWVLYPTGSPGGKSGSPGDGLANCTQCHLGTPLPATSWITSDIPPEGYKPDSVYNITATAMHEGAALFGFELTAEDQSAAKSGTFAIIDPGTQFTNGGNAVTHNVDGTAPTGDFRTWTAEWTAPPAGTGQVTFYAAFNAANGNGNNTGDVIYLSSTGYTEYQNLGMSDPGSRTPDLKIFPNPAQDYTVVSWDKSAKALEEILVFTISGARVINQVFTGNLSGSYHLPLSGLDRGIYLVSTVYDDQSTATVRLIKK